MKFATRSLRLRPLFGMGRCLIGLLALATTISAFGAPAAPAGEAATSITNTGYTANWAASPGATEYTLYEFSSGFKELEAYNLGNVTSYAVIGQAANTQYYYCVTAGDSSGFSSCGNGLYVTTSASGSSVESVSVDVGTTLSDVERKPVGINLDDFYDDNDANRPAGSVRLQTALDSGPQGLGVHYLRWGDQGTIWTNGNNITLSRVGEDDYPSDYSPITVQPPNSTSFTNVPLTFNDFMKACDGIGCIPSIILDEASWYESAPCSVSSSGPTRDQLLAATVEEVKDAQRVHKDPIYWEVGNEPFNAYGGCNGTAFTAAQYTTDVLSWSAAIREVNPDAIVGAACNNTAYCTTVLQGAAGSIDSLIYHTYPEYQTFASYQASQANTSTDLTYYISQPENAISNSGLSAFDQSRMKIDVNETNVNCFGYCSSWPDNNDVGHALANFELLYLTVAEHPKARDVMIWATRWVGESATTDPYYVGTMLTQTNGLTPSGQAMQMMIGSLKNKVVSATTSGDNMVHGYASYDQYGGGLSISLVNRDTVSHSVKVNVKGYTPSSSTATSEVFTGPSPTSYSPAITMGSQTIGNGEISMTVNPFSITILNLSGAAATGLNSVQNASFENSSTNLWPWRSMNRIRPWSDSRNTDHSPAHERTAALTPDANSGVQALLLSNGACASQMVTVTPGTSYLLSGVGKISSGTAIIGVFSFGYTQSTTFSGVNFTSASIPIQFPWYVRSASVVVCAPASGTATVDDVFLGHP